VSAVPGPDGVSSRQQDLQDNPLGAAAPAGAVTAR
jgi:hypothetical protein